MPLRPPFSRAPLYAALKLLLMTPLVPAMLVAQQARAETVRFDKTIDASTPVTHYRVINGATLTGNGAETSAIKVERASALVLNNSSVTSTTQGIYLSAATGTVTGSTINASDTGLFMGRDATDAEGSTAIVRDSIIHGGDTGVRVGSKNTFTSFDTQISGGAFGLWINNGQASVQGGSITGDIGVHFNPGVDLSRPASLVLDGVAVEGTGGAAIDVADYGLPSNPVEIQVNNGSTLKGANGVLLNVNTGATANMSVSNSQLTGDVHVEQGSTANLKLHNAASLTGNLYNVASLAVDSGAQWVMAGDNQLASLSLDGGTVRFGQPDAFHTLSLGELSGNGTFAMQADFIQGRNDFLDVTGHATGNHQLAVTASGQDPLKDASLHMVRIADGDAQFSLLGGPVDLGTWSYDLMRQGNDWYLDSTTKVISPGTASVLALFNAAPTVWYGELSSLRTRMGELRHNPGQAGGWMRAYGNKYDVSTDVNYRQTQQGLSLGADAPLPYGDGQWLVGVLAGYSQSDLDLRKGTSGSVDSFYVGGYGTWLDQQSGYYLDAVVKFNHLRNKADVAMSDGQRSKGNYHNNGLGASLEFGRHIKLDDGYFIEPFGQLSALTVSGKDYRLSNGLRAEGERSGSVLGKLGATAGRDFDLGQGRTVQPYVRAALVHEFNDDNQVRVNDNRFNNDLSGSRGELGVGLAMSFAEQWQVHADFDYSNGKHIDQPWGANVGLRYNW